MSSEKELLQTGLESVSPNDPEANDTLLFFLTGSRKPNSDGSPATGSTSLYLKSHYTLHEMTQSHIFLLMLSQL